MRIQMMVAGCVAAAATFLVVGYASQLRNTDKQVPLPKAKAIVEQRIMTESGLAYEIITPGAGDRPQAGRKVTLHYTGWLEDGGKPGAKFDSSLDRGQPFTFTIGVGQVIRGWDEGVLSMQVGEKRRLIIPAALGYGTRGAGNLIPGGATLIFDVELLSIG